MIPVGRNVTCLLDLPDKVFLFICRYLLSAYVRYSFYTSSRPELRFHSLISDYYTRINLDQINNNEYIYLASLFCNLSNPLQSESLILSNAHVTCLTKHYFTNIPMNLIQSIFTNLKSLTLINCSEEDFLFIYTYNTNMKQLEYLHVTVRKHAENQSIDLTDI
ncbi:unnamed protein product [Rotaria sordida]|uniref:F-box domain-containing protein n=3 Tax=Rotaria sordida TaxID=392033 RepID=A0A815R2L4_9BILA|nr:unnamed protein product [Rotaria sordida]